jgi:hypothetical protein
MGYKNDIVAIDSYPLGNLNTPVRDPVNAAGTMRQ